MKKRILSLILLIAMLLTLVCACEKKETKEADLITFTPDADSTETVSDLKDGKGNVLMTQDEMKLAFNFYVQYYRDLYYQYYVYLSKYYSISSFDTFLSSSVSSSSSDTYETVIKTNAEKQFTQYLVVKRQFVELGLEFDEEDNKAIEEKYDSMVSGLNENDTSAFTTACTKLGITQNQFKDFLVVDEFRKDKIQDYYFGENGENPVTEEDIKASYDKNYTRIKAIILSTLDKDGNELDDDEKEKLKTKAADLVKQAKKKGTSFEKLITANSDNIYQLDDLTEQEDIENATKYNKYMRNTGFLYNQYGYEDMFYTYYESYIDSDIMDAAAKLKVGEVTSVELSTSIWIIKMYDINETAALYESVKDSVKSEIISPLFSDKVSEWETDLSYTLNTEIKDKYEDLSARSTVFASSTSQSSSTTSTTAATE